MSMKPPPSRRTLRSAKVASEDHSLDAEDLLRDASPEPCPDQAEALSSLPPPPPSTAAAAAATPTSTNAITIIITTTTTTTKASASASDTPTSQPQSQAHATATVTATASLSPSSSLTPRLSPRSTHLLSRITLIESQLSSLQTELDLSNAQLTDANVDPAEATTIVKAHISLLQEYNAIRDVGLQLMGLIAEGRGVRLGEVMAGFGVGEGD